MKTEDLIERIAAEPTGPSLAPQKQLALFFALALCAIAAVCLAMFGAPLPALPVTGTASYAMKLGVFMAILAASIAGLFAAGTPGRTITPLAIALCIPFLVIFVLAGTEYAAIGPAGMGSTWARCLLVVGGFGMGGTGLALASARRLAPTRPTLAGFFAGTAGGGLAASAYGLWCPETEAQFLLLWYALPILALGLMGAAIGRHLLRW